MDSDQDAALLTLQMDNIWRVMASFTATKGFQLSDGIVMINTVQVNDMILITYKTFDFDEKKPSETLN